ncbi:hypothetical protein BpHYR1_009086 [Brachionus plicatilis]|uniref:Uncharacterized protein n=1 Tax=Brachionus plicatilis TaxID=10195 RepID=A0A3M7QMT9_BRAPC|nr:hypothetical protein BpHYR1_009086 [Brachionus plicatilis]
MTYLTMIFTRTRIAEWFGYRLLMGNNSGVDDQLDAVTSVSGRSRCSKRNLSKLLNLKLDRRDSSIVSHHNHQRVKSSQNDSFWCFYQKYEFL